MLFPIANCQFPIANWRFAELLFFFNRQSAIGNVFTRT